MIVVEIIEKGFFMTGHIKYMQEQLIQIIPEMQYFSNQTREELKG